MKEEGYDNIPFIFSLKWDLVAFVFPVLLGIFFILLPGNGDFTVGNQQFFVYHFFTIFLVDVPHIWTMLFCTYLDKGVFKDRKSLLIFTPLSILMIVIILFLYGGKSAVWSLVIYFAIFHFVRQQYGWMVIAAKKMNLNKKDFQIDQMMISLITFYPIAHLHMEGLTSPDRGWYFKGDIFLNVIPNISNITLPLLNMMIICYLIREAMLISKNKKRIPKNIIFLSTLVAWHIGIIYQVEIWIANAMIVFSHGIPYMILTFRESQKSQQKGRIVQFIFNRRHSWILFFGVAFVISLIEKGSYEMISSIKEGLSTETASNHKFFVFISILFFVPQLTHFFIDGFLWRTKDGKKSYY